VPRPPAATVDIRAAGAWHVESGNASYERNGGTKVVASPNQKHLYLLYRHFKSKSAMAFLGEQFKLQRPLTLHIANFNQRRAAVGGE
jgi:hypothetical protein